MVWFLCVHKCVYVLKSKKKGDRERETERQKAIEVATLHWRE